MISTKGRYALRVLIDLAEQDSTTYVPLKEIAKRQGISCRRNFRIDGRQPYTGSLPGSRYEYLFQKFPL